MCLTLSYTLDKKCSIKINQREIIQKRNKVELQFLCTAPRVIARNMHTKFGMIGPTVIKLCSGQGNPDAAATANTAADEGNPYMSPF